MLCYKLERGFTLLELMVVLAVAAVLVAIAFPSFQETIRSNNVITAVNDLTASLSLARSDAVRSHKNVIVCPSNDGYSCTNNWTNGWMVWRDTNNNASFDNTDTVLAFSKANPSINYTSTFARVTFDRSGHAIEGNEGGLIAIYLQPTVCTPNADQQRTVRINISGQINTQKGVCT